MSAGLGDLVHRLIMDISCQISDTAGDPIEGISVTLMCMEYPSISFSGVTASDGRPTWAYTGSTPNYIGFGPLNAHWQLTLYSLGEKMPIIPVVLFVPVSAHVWVDLTRRGYTVDFQDPRIDHN